MRRIVDPKDYWEIKVVLLGLPSSRWLAIPRRKP